MQYRQAKDIAIRILRQLEPLCLKSDIVGSVCREKPEVHDMEIAVLPKTIEIKNLFEEVTGLKRMPAFCSTVRSLGLILKGDIEKGRYVQIALPEDINLDLFIPVESDYERQKCIRIGPSEYSHKVIANAWLRLGWCGTENGLRLQTESYQHTVGKDKMGKDKKIWICDIKNPTLPPVWQNEWELYQFLHLKWTEPKNRKA